MAEIKTLSCDIETFSSNDLPKCGVYKYVESPDFEILLFGYSVNEGPVQVVDIACGEEVPEEILKALTDNSVEKWAYNAQFERVCISTWLRKNYPQYFKGYGSTEDTVGNYLDPTSWKCTRVWGAYMGLPLSLKEVGAVLKLDEQKMKEGENLIRYFCVPCAPTKVNDGRTRNLPSDDMLKWELFKKYNKRDVEVELSIKNRLAKFPVPDFLWDEYHIDQTINDRGILLDMPLVENAIKLDNIVKERLTQRMKELTGLDNPNSVLQLKGWLSAKGVDTESLDKKAVKELLPEADNLVTEVLECRSQLAKSSVSKYTAMKNAVCEDGRARGMFSFYGANRTGRWCLTGDHEVLTKTGWVRLDQWQGGSIACWNASNEAVSFQKAKSLCFDYTGAMYTYTDSRIDQCSTPDHKMRVKKRYDADWQDMTVEEMAKTNAFIPAADAQSLEVSLHEIKAKPEIAYFSGKVYCAETSTGYFLVRRNGKAWVTGNSGKIIQLQNLPQNHMEDLAEARALVRDGDFDAVEALYDNIPNVLSELIRTAFIPKPGYKFIVADFSAIEARVLAFLAGEEWRNELFAKGGDIYCQSASEMFKVSVVKNGENGHLRQKGKIAELACIAEGSQVLTDKGLVEIEKVTRDMRVWDGVEWINHDGVVYKGVRQVLTHDGLSATPDHIVWIEGQEKPIPFLDAARLGLTLKHITDEVSTVEAKPKTVRVYDIVNSGPRHRYTVSNCLVHNCGYGGSVGALKAMGALEMGLKEEELQPLVASWREANPNIIDFWWAVDKAVKEAVKTRTITKTHGFTFTYKSGMLFIDLPSGRHLAYVKPMMGENRYGGEAVTYEGVNTGKWTRQESYGPKFVENMTQGVARDILAHSMTVLRDEYIVGSVHDELIIECKPDEKVENICERMSTVPEWFKGLNLKAAGYECEFYQKD